MSLSKTELNKCLVNYIDFIGQIIIMIICVRWAVKQKQCYLFSLFKKCSKYVKRDKKCESFISVIDFNLIDRIIIKLKHAKLKTETVWKTIFEQSRLIIKAVRTKQVKLKQLRQQKKVFKQKKQTMFDINIWNVKELKRLKDLKKTAKIEGTLLFILNFNKLIDVDELKFEILHWLNNFFCWWNFFKYYWHFIKFSNDSHMLSECEYSFHLIRYCWFFLFKTLFVVYNSSFPDSK